MVDQDGFEIEDCDCEYGKMIRMIGVREMVRCTIHYTSALITQLTLNMDEVDTDEAEEAFKNSLADLIVHIHSAFHGLSHYIGAERVDSRMDAREEFIAETNKRAEKAEAAPNN